MAGSAIYMLPRLSADAAKSEAALRKATADHAAETKAYDEVASLLQPAPPLPELQTTFLSVRRIVEQSASDARVSVSNLSFGADEGKAFPVGASILDAAQDIRSTANVKVLSMTVRGTYQDLPAYQAWVAGLQAQLPVALRGVKMQRNEFELAFAVFGSTE